MLPSSHLHLLECIGTIVEFHKARPAISTRVIRLLGLFHTTLGTKAVYRDSAEYSGWKESFRKTEFRGEIGREVYVQSHDKKTKGQHWQGVEIVRTYCSSPEERWTGSLIIAGPMLIWKDCIWTNSSCHPKNLGFGNTGGVNGGITRRWLNRCLGAFGRWPIRCWLVCQPPPAFPQCLEFSRRLIVPAVSGICRVNIRPEFIMRIHISW